MKIISDTTTGEISGCALDSVDFPGSTIIPDNIDVFQNIEKFIYISGAFTLKPYIVVVPGQSSATVNTNVAVTVSLYTSGGALDSSVNGSASVFELGGTTAVGSCNIVNGTGSFSVTSDMPREKMLRVAMPGKYNGIAKITFTAA